MTTHLIALGVNDYRAPVAPLKCCQRDAREVVSVFKERFGFNAHLIESATLDALVATLRYIESVLAPGDVFLFYFSGHGKSHQDDHFLLLPDVDLDDLAEAAGGRSEFGAISYLHLKRQTARPAWRGVQRLFILDACRTPLIEDKAGQHATFESGFLLKDIRLSRKARLADQTAGLTVVNSCDDGASASELADAGHGLFTAAFLQRARQAENHGGTLTVDSQFCRDLEIEMSRMAGEARMPRSVWHRPVIGGAPVELRSMRSPQLADESIEWEICLARPSVEVLERFIRNFPESIHKRDALLRLSQLSDGLRPADAYLARRQTADSPASLVRTANDSVKQPPVQRKVSLYPPTRAKPSAPLPSPQSPARASAGRDGRPSGEPELAQSPAERPALTEEEAAKRDERLWALALGNPTIECFEQYLQEASADAPMRQAASAKLKQLRRPDLARKVAGPPAREPSSVAKAPAEVSRSSEWNPEPAPEFKLSLDKAANLLSGKNRR